MHDRSAHVSLGYCEFEALGAKVIGISPDDIETLHEFSVSECRNKFAVASDAARKVMTDYDAVLTAKPEYAHCTTYVIAPDGRAYSYTELKPDKHVENALIAVRKLASK